MLACGCAAVTSVISYSPCTKETPRIRARRQSLTLKRDFVVHDCARADLRGRYSVARHFADNLERGLFHCADSWVLVLERADGQFDDRIDIRLAFRHLFALADQARHCPQSCSARRLEDEQALAVGLFQR